MGEQRMIRLLIADEHQVIREGLRAMLIGSPEIELVGSVTSVQEAIRLVGEIQPDVLLIDPHAPSSDGLRAIKLIHGEWPQTAIIAFTVHHTKDHILPALQAGVSAYLTLHTRQTILRNAIRVAAEGQTLLQPEHIAYLLTPMDETKKDQPITPDGKDKDNDKREELKLTERECQVLHGVAHGERNKEIATRLGISEPTVKSHLANIYFKLSVDSRASAVAVAIQRGILSLQKSYL